MKRVLRWESIADWADAADPGALRRRHAARAALAALTAWLAMHTMVGLIVGRPMPTIGLFAVTVCFICALVIVDARRSARSTTLLLSTAMFAVALLLASLLQAARWLYALALLVLIFASYAGGRLGLQPGELLLILTMGLYFATNSRVGWASLPWFVAAVVAGVASLWLWQFVLLPYDPAQGLRDSVRSFYDRAADLAGALGAGFDDELLAPVDEARANDLERRLRQLKRSRRVIESQFPGRACTGRLAA